MMYIRTRKMLCPQVCSGRVSGAGILLGLKLLSVQTTFSHTACFQRLTCIKGPFSTVVLWKMVEFWVYTVGWPSESRFALLNRVREKGNFLGYPDYQPQFGFHLVYNSEGIWRKLIFFQFYSQIVHIAT